MKKWIAVILLLAAAGWAYTKWPLFRSAGGDDDATTRPRTAVVEPRDIRFVVNAAGDIGPADQVSVRPEVNGRIESLPVDIGDTVRKGDLLFTLDDRDLQIEKESQEKAIERSKLELEQAERNFRRSEQLIAANLISQELFEDTRTQFELARNALERADKSLDLINDRLRKTRIVAPFDCTVLTRSSSIGQAVSGSGGFNSGTEVLTIANLDDLIINAHINQADVTRLRADQEVQVSVEAVPGLVVTGIVERIAPQATIKNNIKGFATRILLKKVDKRIRPGMTANIQIPVAAADGVLAVPLAAVFSELNPETQQMERFVVVQGKGGDLERRPVEVGVSDNFFAEVSSGLSPGEAVVVEFTKDELARLTKPAASGSEGVAAVGGGGSRTGSAPAAARAPTPISTTATNATNAPARRPSGSS